MTQFFKFLFCFNFNFQDDFINNVEISDAIVPSSALVTAATVGVSRTPMVSTGSIFSQAPAQQLSQQLQVQIQQDVTG